MLPLLQAGDIQTFFFSQFKELCIGISGLLPGCFAHGIDLFHFFGVLCFQLANIFPLSFLFGGGAGFAEVGTASALFTFRGRAFAFRFHGGFLSDHRERKAGSEEGGKKFLHGSVPF